MPVSELHAKEPALKYHFKKLKQMTMKIISTYLEPSLWNIFKYPNGNYKASFRFVLLTTANDSLQFEYLPRKTGNAPYD